MRTTNHVSTRSLSLLGGLLLLILCVLLACDTVEVERYYENGAIATTSPIASTIGLQVMQEGGNAYDAAIAAAFVLAVVHPQAGNIGGGGFAVIRDGATDTVRALDFRETAPGAATDTMFLDADSNVIEGLSLTGARASGVPGSVAGLYALWQEYGSWTWEDLISIAAQLADTGFVVNVELAEDLARYRTDLSQFESTVQTFFPNGRAPVAGDRMTLPDLAATLYRIAAEGPDVFYQGEIAALIDSTMRAHDGLITRADLAAYEPIWRDPTYIRFDSLDIYIMSPPSSGGIITGQILKILEGYDTRRFNPKSPDYMHRFVEAARLAFADRSVHLGDPNYYPIPADLLDPNYINSRRALIDPDRAGSSSEILPGHPGGVESEQTTHLSVCDAAGNMVAITTTINTSFGNKLVVAGAGFLLNNEMDDFAIKPGYPNEYGLIGGEANKVEPGKRMLSSMSPTIVMKDGEPFLITGSPGGSKIITTVAQGIINFSRFDMSLGETVAMPRYHHQWLPDVTYLEQGGFDVATKQALIRMGHHIEEREPWGDLQMIHIAGGGLMQAASDPRNNGLATGY